MSKTRHQCNLNLSTPAADAAETGARVHPESARLPSDLAAPSESIPADIQEPLQTQRV